MCLCVLLCVSLCVSMSESRPCPCSFLCCPVFLRVSRRFCVFQCVSLCSCVAVRDLTSSPVFLAHCPLPQGLLHLSPIQPPDTVHRNRRASFASVAGMLNGALADRSPDSPDDDNDGGGAFSPSSPADYGGGGGYDEPDEPNAHDANAAPGGAATAAANAQQQPRRGDRVRKATLGDAGYTFTVPKVVVDPWKQLDPHVDDEAARKPLQRGACAANVLVVFVSVGAFFASLTCIRSCGALGRVCVCTACVAGPCHCRMCVCMRMICAPTPQGLSRRDFVQIC